MPYPSNEEIDWAWDTLGDSRDFDSRSDSDIPREDVAAAIEILEKLVFAREKRIEALEQRIKAFESACGTEADYEPMRLEWLAALLEAFHEHYDWQAEEDPEAVEEAISQVSALHDGLKAATERHAGAEDGSS